MFFSGLFTMWNIDGTNLHPSSTKKLLNFPSTGTTNATWVPVAFLLLFVIASMLGLLPIPWTMTAELFPIEIRGVAHSIAYSSANILMFAAVQCYEGLMSTFNGAAGVQFFFAVISICGMLYTFVFVPETHKKKLTEIEEYFNHNLIYLGQKKEKRKSRGKKEKKVDKEQTEKLMNV